MKRPLLIIFVTLSIFITAASAQRVPSPALTADSIATGNYKDVLNSFFRSLSINLPAPIKKSDLFQTLLL